MKRELIFLIGLSSAIYATQEISCVDFVNLSKVEAKSYINKYRREFELNHFKTKGHTDSDKAYIGMQEGMSQHILRCIDLRKVTHYGVGDVRRALILTSLSKKALTPEEQSLYQKSLQENIVYYQAYSNSSISNAQYMPLVYLTIQRTNDKRYYIIYEFRKNGAVIQRYGKKIPVSKPYIKFSDINSVSNQNYLSYIQQQYPAIQIYKAKKANTVKKNKTYSGEKYEVTSWFNALKADHSNTSVKIYTPHILTKLREEGGKVYFKIKGEECVATQKNWINGTKKYTGGKQ